MMGLGYPGGVLIDRLAANGDRRKYSFPRARIKAISADFSFSGLKTSLRAFLASSEGKSARIEDIAASFQEAIVDVLVMKAFETARRENVLRLVLSGGVSANSRLRELSTTLGAASGIEVLLPSKALCTDNAAMVALLGERRMSQKLFSGPELNAYAASRFSRG
jgi:N6-L-threonylcarbamoyladenine synthase